jgi:hypothetical protein
METRHPPFTKQDEVRSDNDGGPSQHYNNFFSVFVFHLELPLDQQQIKLISIS